MDTVAYFLIGMVVYGAGPCAIAYMIYRFLSKRVVKPRFFVDHDEDFHPHGGRWAKP
ncbi:hypothetical protein QU481_21800 [Crenobacter sp. SG2303]|uniref:Uncharacterized protein n=1 Tax=Crenobacter oryzisoli TaxID=3056844 RepID=A0ABT7XUH9_9NEIS|nr:MULTISPECIES: hypothetical protein [unclassified Crenobacter]MDN0077461.1 hypothetical protein [Crenobacter sp. SG2303]MDN0085500.1 hypothetical protein [Crenobacter sp. SG2305]